MPVYEHGSAGYNCPGMVTIVQWHLGHVVAALRAQFGWTQPQLAKKAGVNKATVVSVEAMDRNHGRQTYEKIAKAFGVTVAELYALVPESKETQRGARTSDLAAGKTFHKS
jgi:DNA-binding XRE family transcriptional regulator